MKNCINNGDPVLNTTEFGCWFFKMLSTEQLNCPDYKSPFIKDVETLIIYVTHQITLARLVS